MTTEALREPVRYHLTDGAVTVQTTAGPVEVGTGWLLITEAEYARLTKPKDPRAQVHVLTDRGMEYETACEALALLSPTQGAVPAGWFTALLEIAEDFGDFAEGEPASKAASLWRSMAVEQRDIALKALASSPPPPAVSEGVAGMREALEAIILKHDPLSNHDSGPRSDCSICRILHDLRQALAASPVPAGGWRPGARALHNGLGVEVELVAPDGQWWKVRCSDGSGVSCRQSHLTLLPPPPKPEEGGL